MAGTPIKLRVDVEMAELIRQAQKASDGVEDLSGSFRGVEDASRDAARDAERSLTDVADAADDTGGALDDVGGKAGDLAGSFQGVGDAAKSALEGDTVGAVQGVTDAIGGLAGAIPLVGGVVAGVSAVVGMALAADQQYAADTKAKISDLYDAMVENQTKALQSSMLLSQAQDLIADDAKFAKAKEYSDLLGIDLPTVIGALVGDTEDLAAAQSAVSGRLDEVGGSVSAFSSTQDAAAGKAQKLYSALQDANGAFLNSQTAVDGASAKYDAFSGFAEKAKADVDGVTESMNKVPAGKDVKITADTSAFDAAVARLTMPSTKTIRIQQEMANNLSPAGRFGTGQALG